MLLLRTIFNQRLKLRNSIMKIHDDKKRERIYTHRKTILDKEALIRMLPKWDINKFNLLLDALKQKEVIEITGTEAKIFLLPLTEKELKNSETTHQPILTPDESELLTLLTRQSTNSQ